MRELKQYSREFKIEALRLLETSGKSAAQLERVVRGLVRHGLAGIEAYHTDHTDTQTGMYLEMARRLGVGVTGGSDYHGVNKPDVRLGRPRVPLSAIDGPLREIILPEES